ncbi:hypothetical protein GCM10010919_01770 [Alishewanella longhuensis]|uniref:DUF4920 domain-containing protein n=1 Tax=Alishewanella longhuensis TaxID=1091037 RepID=A0ABQ3L1R8_9ALTE|nr:DUF4920 domain-containing protein [Alishewanella longhuensis]GHG59338.1 hypothetical protein GCM10010919_01770 [Alishewanella longhuensis]
MLKPLLLSAALLVCSPLLAANITFGDTVNKQQVTAVAQILTKPADYLEQTVTVVGEVTGVCSKQNCWMTLATAEDEPRFRIKVRDGDMLFPLSAKGKTAYATGVVKVWSQGEGNADAYQLVPTAVEIAE